MNSAQDYSTVLSLFELLSTNPSLKDAKSPRVQALAAFAAEMVEDKKNASEMVHRSITDDTAEGKYMPWLLMSHEIFPFLAPIKFGRLINSEKDLIPKLEKLSCLPGLVELALLFGDHESLALCAVLRLVKKDPDIDEIIQRYLDNSSRLSNEEKRALLVSLGSTD